MTKKRQILFSMIRGLLAILIALLVATLLIFLSAEGGGFSEKTLEELSKDDQTMYATDHVGIRNIRQRFRLIYGKDVLFAFYNTPQGPVSEILIPLNPKKKEEDEDDGPDCG